MAFWLIYFTASHLAFAPILFSPYNLLISGIFLVHNMGTAYVTLDWWFPLLYKKKRYGRFVVATMLTVLLFAALLGATLLGLLNLTTDFSATLETIDQYYKDFYASVFWSNFSAVTAFMIPYFILQRIESDRRTRQLEKEKLEAELKLLKSQLNPHFLFNALNNIYFLIKKDPNTAAEALAGFSDLLRFQLYQANNKFVALDQEIDYLKQYIKLAQLRKDESFQVHWQFPENTQQLKIAPLLLMPLVENAFKHSPHKSGKIDIQLDLKPQILHFHITNTKESAKSQPVSEFEDGGIGLVNIRKRLNLIYPQSHDLNITESADLFEVDLILKLKKQKTES